MSGRHTTVRGINFLNETIYLMVVDNGDSLLDLVFFFKQKQITA